MTIAQYGWDNVAVDVDGDNNTITISRGTVELVLFQRHLFGWLKTQLIGEAGSEALAGAEKAPEDADAQTVLEVQVRKLLEREPGLTVELDRLVKEAAKAAPERSGQSLSQIGDHNRAANVRGDGNTTTVS